MGFRKCVLNLKLPQCMQANESATYIDTTAHSTFEHIHDLRRVPGLDSFPVINLQVSWCLPSPFEPSCSPDSARTIKCQHLSQLHEIENAHVVMLDPLRSEPLEQPLFSGISELEFSGGRVCDCLRDLRTLVRQGAQLDVVTRAREVHDGPAFVFSLCLWRRAGSGNVNLFVSELRG